PERAAAPKEIVILERMPLTDVGKPAKPLLRRDAAQRAFQSALAEAVGGAAGITVEVVPDAATGTSAVITMSKRARPAMPATARMDVEQRVRALMSRYAVAHRIEWAE